MYWGVPMIWPAPVSVRSFASLPTSFAMPKSAILTRPSLSKQHVLRLDVAVDHAVVVGVLQGVADLRDDGQGFLRRELARVQQPPQVHPVDKLHEEVVERSVVPGPSPDGRGESDRNRGPPRHADG